ncbi:uncharacterized protein TrAFT101_000282 [Trichoderma asperellum]|uniref:uncharacterized protein n=1 Tax=Trichoderma asperellum TaxID=101201 RepID=UPI00332C1F15|nr:hypothetical protein TrAFT101_000282 [Trichoderma asperellum]
MDSSLLFVNKTQTSRILSRSKAGERSAILSHVQSKRRRHEAETSQISKPWAGFTTTLSKSEASEISETVEEKLTFLVDNDDLTARSAKSLAVNKKQKQQREAAEKRLSLAYASSKSLSKAMQPSYNASDPFHCTVANLDAGTHAILHITFSHASRVNFLAESFAPLSTLLQHAPMRHDRMFQLRLKRCVEDQKLMYSTLAYGSSLLGWTMGRFHSSKQPEYFLDKALRAVRVYLSTPGYVVDDWLLLSMYGLAITEMWNCLPIMWRQLPERHAMASKQGSRGFSACRMHLKTLLQVVDDAGGWERFDPYVLDSVILADKFMAITSRKPPVIPATWDPGPLPFATLEECGITEEGLLTILPRLGTGFFQEALSEDLNHTLQDLVAYCRIASTVWSYSSTRLDTEGWLFRQSQSISYRFLIYALEQNANYLERCTSLASLAFILTSIPARGPQMSAQEVTSHLFDLLQEEHFLEEKVNMSDGLWFWLLFMGCVVSEPSPHRLWFLERMTDCCDGGEMTESNFEQRLEPYLFLPSRQGARIPAVLEYLNSMATGRWNLQETL